MRRKVHISSLHISNDLKCQNDMLWFIRSQEGGSVKGQSSDSASYVRAF